MDDKEIQTFIYGKRGQGKDLQGRYYSLDKFKAHLSQFLTQTSFTLQPRSKDKKGMTRNNYDSFIMKLKGAGLEGIVAFDEIDSKVYSTKTVTYSSGENILSGTFTLALIRKEDEEDPDMSYEEKVHLEKRKKMTSNMNDEDWNNPEAYTKRKEWVLEIKGNEPKRYEVTKKDDLTILRNKIIPVFVKEYTQELLSLYA